MNPEDSHHSHAARPASAGCRIAFVQAGWHIDILDQGRESFVEELAALGIDPERVDGYRVPGAFELPLKCKQLCKTGDYGLAVAAGFVVDGGIYRHEFVAQAVVSGLMQVQLELEVPLLSLVLTPKDFHENGPHREFFYRHFRIKGQEAARAAAALLNCPPAARTTAAAAG